MPISREANDSHLSPARAALYSTMNVAEAPRRLNGSVAHSLPAKRPRLEVMEREPALALRKKHIAYVFTSTEELCDFVPSVSLSISHDTIAPQFCTEH